MASHTLSGLEGTKENSAGTSPTKEGFKPAYDGPRDHVDLLEYYYGHPTSTKKSHGAPSMSSW